MNVIEFSHVRKSFRDFAIKDLSFSVPEGTVCGLIGENGAGKSTTIRLLMGALRRDAGTVRVRNADPASAQFRYVKEDIGVVLDEAYFPETLTAHQIQSVMRSTYRRWDDTFFTDGMHRFDLPEKKRVKEYSRGMRMKLAIVCALSHAPKLLVLDEATAGLDPVVRDEILDMFYDFTRQEDHSILISSHILSDLEKLCDEIAFLHDGELLFCQDKDSLPDEYGLFAGTAQQAEHLPPEAVVGLERSHYGGVRALLKRELVPARFPLERPNLEDIILFMIKDVKAKSRTDTAEHITGDMET